MSIENHSDVDDGYTTDENSYYEGDEYDDDYWYISEVEREFLDSDKPDGYYIGISALHVSSGKLIFANAITPKSFFRYDFDHVMGYLVDYSIITEIRKPKLHIMKLIRTQSQRMTVVIKTHWIRIIQRTFRKIYQRQREIIAIRRQPRSILQFSVFGKYLDGANHFPTLRGMLSGLASNYQVSAIISQ
jgi:hypothetical protein